MAMQFSKTPVAPSKVKVTGPNLTISPKRQKINFSAEASTLMGLVPGSTFIEIGFDDELKRMGMIVTTSQESFNSVVTKTNVAEEKSYNLIFVGEKLKESENVNTEKTMKYELKQENDFFYVELDKGAIVPKAIYKKKPKKIAS